MKGLRTATAWATAAGLALSLGACSADGATDAGKDPGYGASMNQPKKSGGMSCGGSLEGPQAMFLILPVTNDTDKPMSVTGVQAGHGQNVRTEAGLMKAGEGVARSILDTADLADDEARAWHLSTGSIPDTVRPVPVDEPVQVDPGSTVYAGVYGTPDKDGELGGLQGMTVTLEENGAERRETADVAMWSTTKGMADDACTKAPERVPAA